MKKLKWIVLLAGITIYAATERYVANYGSGDITLADNTVTNVLAARPNRKWLMIHNPDGNANSLWYTIANATPTTASMSILKAGERWWMDTTVPSGKVWMYTFNASSPASMTVKYEEAE